MLLPTVSVCTLEAQGPDESDLSRRTHKCNQVQTLEARSQSLSICESATEPISPRLPILYIVSIRIGTKMYVLDMPLFRGDGVQQATLQHESNQKQNALHCDATVRMRWWRQASLELQYKCTVVQSRFYDAHAHEGCTHDRQQRQGMRALRSHVPRDTAALDFRDTK